LKLFVDQSLNKYVKTNFKGLYKTSISWNFPRSQNMIGVSHLKHNNSSLARQPCLDPSIQLVNNRYKSKTWGYFSFIQALNITLVCTFQDIMNQNICCDHHLHFNIKIWNNNEIHKPLHRLNSWQMISSHGKMKTMARTYPWHNEPFIIIDNHTNILRPFFPSPLSYHKH